MPKPEEPTIIPPEDPAEVRERDLQNMPDYNRRMAAIAMHPTTNKTPRHSSGWED